MATRKRGTTTRRTTTTRAATPKRSTTAKRSTTSRARTTRAATKEDTGGMSVREAGRKGGLIGGRKGGQTVLRERGPQFYSEIGKKGGQRVRELIALAKELEESEAAERPARRGRRSSR